MSTPLYLSVSRTRPDLPDPALFRAPELAARLDVNADHQVVVQVLMDRHGPYPPGPLTPLATVLPRIERAVLAVNPRPKVFRFRDLGRGDRFCLPGVTDVVFRKTGAGATDSEPTGASVPDALAHANAVRDSTENPTVFSANTLVVRL